MNDLLLDLTATSTPYARAGALLYGACRPASIGVQTRRAISEREAEREIEIGGPEIDLSLL